MTLDQKDLEEIKTKRIFELLDDNSDIKYLIKDINPQFLEFVDKKIENEIQRVLHIPEFDGESFGNASGVAIAYKLHPFETLCGIKEANFRLGLQKRIELIINFLEILSGSIYSNERVNIHFSRNLPNDYITAVDIIAKGKGNIPLKILLSKYPDITDVDEAINMLKQEQDLSGLMIEGYDEGGMVDE